MRWRRDLQTIVAPLVSDSWTKKSMRSDRTRTSRSTVTYVLVSTLAYVVFHADDIPHQVGGHPIQS